MLSPLPPAPSPCRERGSEREPLPSPDRGRGRGRGQIAGGVVLLTIAACAKLGPPPGGPPDALPPEVTSTRPDSFGVYPGFDGNVEFQFSETVSEGSSPNLGYGTGDLERLIIISPSEGVPKVQWERSRITARPRDGWRPNTVYRVELLPGVTDLRRNRVVGGRVVTFTTGAPLPTDSLRGIVVDWTTRQVARQATVEALLLPDSLPYRTQTDSTGRFALAPLPHGAYLLRAFLDQNKNRRLDGREVWDSAGIAPAPTAQAALWLAPRDTAGPRVAQASVRDTLTVEIQLTQPLDPAQRLDTTNVRLLLLPDSTPVRVLSFLSKADDDSMAARAKARADSLRADSIARARPDTGAAPARPPAADTARAAPRPPQGRGRAQPPVDSALIRLLASRPPLGDKAVLRVAAPLAYSTSYALEILGVRNVNGVPGRAVGGFKTSAPPPPPKAAADSTVSDSTAPRGRKPPPGQRPRATPPR
ncbi:MAG TPA: Ig-like domain-containing protein [Gemmatimonadales bacterium]|nr:Ig-like domain-containing protein [Gemmatimonadales bacterium]